MKHLYAYIWGPWVTLPNLKGSAWFVSVYVKLSSTKQKDFAMRWEMWSNCAGVYLLWLMHHHRGKHGLATLCQRRSTHLFIMTFWMNLTFRLSRVYRHHFGADCTHPLLLLLLSDHFKEVYSLKGTDWLKLSFLADPRCGAFITNTSQQMGSDPQNN